MRYFKLFLVISLFISIIPLIISGCSPSTFNLVTSVTPQDGGVINPASGTFNKGTDVTLVATPSLNYEFVEWTGEASGNTNPLVFNMNSDKQIIAQFSQIQYSVNINVEPEDGGTVQPSSNKYGSGDQLNLVATPNEGYSFDRWSGSFTGNNAISSITVNSNQTITAHFVKVDDLSITILKVGPSIQDASKILDITNSLPQGLTVSYDSQAAGRNFKPKGDKSGDEYITLNNPLGDPGYQIQIQTSRVITYVGTSELYELVDTTYPWYQIQSFLVITDINTSELYTSETFLREYFRSADQDIFNDLRNVDIGDGASATECGHTGDGLEIGCLKYQNTFAIILYLYAAESYPSLTNMIIAIKNNLEPYYN